MPVSTDGVLLGAWASLRDCNRIVDIGTGTGLLSLMCAQRFASARVTAIEINAHAAQAARHNFQHSPWPDRVTLVEQDVLSFWPSDRFDAIICNPPYFNSGESANCKNRAQARHTVSLNHQALLDKCRDLLRTNGKACFILPVTEGEQFVEMAQESGWNLAQLCQVRPTLKKPVSRLLIELRLEPAKLHNSELIIHADGSYSEDFVGLTRDFYLKM